MNARIRRNGQGRNIGAGGLGGTTPRQVEGSVIRLERVKVGGGEGRRLARQDLAVHGPDSGEDRGRPDVPLVHRRSRVAVAVADLEFHQEVLDAIERCPRIDIAGAATDPVRAAEILSLESPDTMVLCPVLAEALRHPTTRLRLPRVLVVAQEMTVPVLREAIEIGAHAVYSWPDEREELLEGAASVPSAEPDRGGRRAKVIALLGARGGAGVTFLATNLAAVMADCGLRVVLADLDHAFGELSLAVGIAKQEGWRTIADLVPVVDELAPQHVEDALVSHTRGFRALLAAKPGTPPPPAGLYGASVALLAGSVDVIVLHAPRWSEELGMTAAGLADEVVVVATDDVFSLYGVRTLLAALDGSAGRARRHLVVNRTRRRRLRGGEFEVVAGIPPAATVRTDRAVRVRQDRGELLSSRSRRAGRDVRRIAAMLVPAKATEDGR